MITQSKLKEWLVYNPDTGFFAWRKGRNSGQRAGWVMGQGYREIRIEGEVYRAHRLAFVYMTGDCPPMVDHKNGHRDDNRWENLREATNSQNCANQKVRSTNKSGVKGVSWIERDQKWNAYIRVDGKGISLGNYGTKEEAALAYQRAAVKYFGEFARME